MRDSTKHGLMVSAVIVLAISGIIVAALYVGRLVQPHYGTNGAMLVLLLTGVGGPLGIFGAYIFNELHRAHRSWRVNRSRYPAVKAAMDQYLQPGERIRRLLPAFVIDGKRYFLARYGRTYREWLETEKGMVVFDDHGRAQKDETLLKILLRYTWYVSGTFRLVMVRNREELIAIAPRTQREIAKVREFFERDVIPAGGEAVRQALEAFLEPLGEQVARLSAMAEREHRWCRVNGGKTEFSAEELEPLRRARSEESQWMTENADRIAEGWRSLKVHRSSLENMPSLLPHQRDHLRRMMRGLEASAKAATDKGNFTEQIAPERIEAFRTRTAKALQLEKQRS